jgi:hypothetical protein
MFLDRHTGDYRLEASVGKKNCEIFDGAAVTVSETTVLASPEASSGVTAMAALLAAVSDPSSTRGMSARTASGAFEMTTMSTRRFFARSSGVVPSVRGRDEP